MTATGPRPQPVANGRKGLTWSESSSAAEAASWRAARVTSEELLAAVRAAGVAALDEVEAVVLETDGSFSVVGRTERQGATSLDGVRR